MQVSKTKLFVRVLLLCLAAIYSVYTVFQHNRERLPLINGVIIPEAKALGKFSIIDHTDRPFSNQQLVGKWHLLTYGYTNCPDVCPMTLNVLAQLKQKLKSENKFDDLEVLFYSIDPERDTTKRLAEYLPFFDDDFLGLTNPKFSVEKGSIFEKNLGMISVLTQSKDQQEIEAYGKYRVSHGYMLYLINPDGALQAVFRPTKGVASVSFYTVETLYQDYILVRDYFG